MDNSIKNGVPVADILWKHLLAMVLCLKDYHKDPLCLYTVYDWALNGGENLIDPNLAFHQSSPPLSTHSITEFVFKLAIHVQDYIIN